MKEKIKVFLSQNWFKLAITMTVILVGFSFFYYFVVLGYQREQSRMDQETQKQLLQEQEKQEKEEEIQKQAELADQAEYWDNLKKQIQVANNATNESRSEVESLIIESRDWLVGAYFRKSSPNYYKLIPLINAKEHYVITLQNIVDSLDKVSSIRDEMISAIEQPDRIILDIDNLGAKENIAVDALSYWIEQEQKEARDINVLATESAKNY
jgi:signal transduction histidine kinase